MVPLKTTHPKITRILQALDVYSQNQCEMFFWFLLHSIDLVSQLQTCFEIVVDFVMAVSFSYAYNLQQISFTWVCTHEIFSIHVTTSHKKQPFLNMPYPPTNTRSMNPLCLVWF